jgi:hypothetical protein
MIEFFHMDPEAGSFVWVDVNLKNVRRVRITREPNRFRFDMIDDKGVTTTVLTFPDTGRDERDKHIKDLENKLEEIRVAGGWGDPPDYGDE